MNKMPGLVFFLFWGCCALSSERICFGSKNVRKSESNFKKWLGGLSDSANYHNTTKLYNAS